MIYFADALPQCATKLMRTDATGERRSWTRGRCEAWHPRHGWRCYPDGKMQIMATGDWDRIAAEDVAVVQANIIAICVSAAVK